MNVELFGLGILSKLCATWVCFTNSFIFIGESYYEV
jgi:hypothetical protein